MKKTLSFDEACDYLKISTTSLTDLVLIGEVPGAKISQQWVFKESDLDEYLTEQIRIQTDQRREAFKNGVGKIHVNTSVATVRRGRRRVLPVLPELPSEA